MFRGKFGKVHFIGIGGSGMSGIAEVLANMGFSVSGSDMKESAVVARLRGLGARVFIGHDPQNVAGVDVVVRSTAVSDGNPEVVAANQAKIPVIPRAEMLAELMRMKYGLAVAGTHGKTTTTSMLATCLHRSGLDPTVVIGGRLDALGSNARLGRGDYLVAEADESDGSFLLLDPTVAVITNIDPEHMEHWGSFDALVDGFVSFANRVPFYGFSVVCLDHPVVQRILPRLRRRTLTYGFGAQAEVRADRVRQVGRSVEFRVWRRDEVLGDVRLDVPGRHNVLNALAATTVALELDLPFTQVQEALHGFGGVDRRFSERANVGGVLIVDDYGHHPVEIQATLAAASEGFEGRRIVAVFQPHRYTRVADLWADFCASFNAAAHVVVCPVYAAGEAPIEGVDATRIVRGLADHGHRSVVSVPDLDGAVEHLAGFVRAGDIVITLGAGDVNRVCAALADRLRGRTEG
ncbi:MAG: UDP-N-acetylmuramate--L-alanine ligase [Pseudomonadota bacterium]|nr:UDP-N-acetylmuramate--L-alanine ligase [Pseudomonadota bacterium]